jgi:hypothetical protein
MDGAAVTIAEPCLDCPKVACGNCGEDIADHCSVHLIPCCPGRCPAATSPEQIRVDLPIDTIREWLDKAEDDVRAGRMWTAHPLAVRALLDEVIRSRA